MQIVQWVSVCVITVLSGGMWLLPAMAYANRRGDSPESEANDDVSPEDQTDIARLKAELSAKTLELNLISSDVHDGLLQDVISAKIFLESATEQLEKVDATVASAVKHAEEFLSRAIVEGRRIIDQSQHCLVDEVGFEQALQDLARLDTGNDGIQVVVHASELPDLGVRIERIVFRIVQEALRNVERHSRAEHASVRLDVASGELLGEIRDDGCGFDADSVEESRFGLKSMAARASSIGGELSVHSQPGSGTQIRFQIPLVE